MGATTALSLGDPVRHPVNFRAPARLLSLDGRWFSRTIRQSASRCGSPTPPSTSTAGCQARRSSRPRGRRSGSCAPSRRPRRAVLTRASLTVCREGCSATPYRWAPRRCFHGSRVGLRIPLTIFQFVGMDVWAAPTSYEYAQSVLFQLSQ